MNRGVLLLNAGSSSLKCSCHDLESGQLLASGQADWAGEQARFRFTNRQVQTNPQGAWESVSWRGVAAAVNEILMRLRAAGWSLERELTVVGHRVVHGGDFREATQICPEVRGRIEQLVKLAPLHNEPCLQALQAVERELPAIPQIAVFDSGFHATISETARTYALPWKWTSEWGIRRFGFHGLSHQYCSRRAAEWLPAQGKGKAAETLRVVVCHLGHGCSLAAVRGGVSVDTTMGFTPLEGLVMATRCGSIDPGIIPYLQSQQGLSTAELEHVLNRESGLLGISGLSADLREIQAAADNGHERAQLANSIYIHSIQKGIGAMAASLGGLDVVVFTAGVGENSPRVRALVCKQLDFLGIELDQDLNANCSPDAEISRPSSRTKVLVLATQEEQEMFREVRELIG
jgi:acetate kinase